MNQLTSKAHTFYTTKEAKEKLNFLTLSFSFRILKSGQIIPTAYCFYTHEKKEEISFSLSMFTEGLGQRQEELDFNVSEEMYLEAQAEKLIQHLLDTLFAFLQEPKD